MLIADNISLQRGTHQLLDTLSMQVQPGEVVAILGANGAGKSSLLKVLSGEWQPSNGHIMLNGKSLRDWSAKQLALYRAVLPQHSMLSFPFPVQEVVMMGRSPHRNSAHQHQMSVQQAMAQVGIHALAHRDYTTLSGGERQRVHLARILAQLDYPTEQARFLLLDEPTSSLDLAHQHALLRLMRRLITQGIGVVVIEHDLNLAAQYADRVLCLKQGQLYATGKVQDTLVPAVIEAVYGIRAEVVQLGNKPFVAVLNQ